MMKNVLGVALLLACLLTGGCALKIPLLPAAMMAHEPATNRAEPVAAETLTSAVPTAILTSAQ
jgi:hypothetical protein